MNKSRFDETVDYPLYILDTDVWIDLTKQLCLIRKSPYTCKIAKLSRNISVEEFLKRLFPEESELCVTKEIKEEYKRAMNQDKEFLKDISEDIKKEIFEYMNSLSEGEIVS